MPKLTLAEIGATAGEEPREAMRKVAEALVALEVTADADRLASLRVEAGAVVEAHSVDACHVAVAVTCRADTIGS